MRGARSTIERCILEITLELIGKIKSKVLQQFQDKHKFKIVNSSFEYDTGYIDGLSDFFHTLKDTIEIDKPSV